MQAQAKYHHFPITASPFNSVGNSLGTLSSYQLNESSTLASFSRSIIPKIWPLPHKHLQTPSAFVSFPASLGIPEFGDIFSTRSIGLGISPRRDSAGKGAEAASAHRETVARMVANFILLFRGRASELLNAKGERVSYSMRWTFIFAVNGSSPRTNWVWHTLKLVNEWIQKW